MPLTQKQHVVTASGLHPNQAISNLETALVDMPEVRIVSVGTWPGEVELLGRKIPGVNLIAVVEEV